MRTGRQYVKLIARFVPNKTLNNLASSRIAGADDQDPFLFHDEPAERVA